MRRGRQADPATTPVIIIVRDRVEPLRLLVDWLERAGAQHLVLLDNASTYPPLVEYLAASPHDVRLLGKNLGHRSPWLSGVAQELGWHRHYVVTDPDVVPDEGCPHDVLAHLHDVLSRYPTLTKAGLGLRIDDLPAQYIHRADVVAWEAQFWRNQMEPGLFAADLDTTFALHRARTPGIGGVAARTGWPYVARHLPWYSDSANPTEEGRYYRRHTDAGVNSWDLDVLPQWKRATIDHASG